MDLKDPPVVTVEPVTVDDLRISGFDLMRAYAREMEPELADDLDPNWAAYAQMERMGLLVAFGAWSGRDIVGFGSAYLAPRAEYQGSLHAHHQALYVYPKFRRGSVGLRLIRALVGEAKERGATEFLMHAPQGAVRFEQILGALGFSTYATIWRKVLCQP